MSLVGVACAPPVSDETKATFFPSGKMRGAGTPACEPASAIQRSSLATSRALCQRSSGSFSRHFRTTWSSAGGITGTTSEIGRGCACRIAATRLVFDLPSKARLPVAIS